MATITETITLETIRCISCQVVFAIPSYMKNRLKESHAEFYCPSGHSQYYSGDNEAEALRKELKRKEQELADKSIEKLRIKDDLDAANKKLKRLTNGVCPCCNRSFHNLQQHMKKQHPEAVVPTQKKKP